MTELSPPQRRSNAVGAAREFYRLSGEALTSMADSQRAIAFALQGILRLQIEQVEANADPPWLAAAPDLLTDEEFVDKVTAMRTPPVADGGRWTRPGRCPNEGGMCNCTGACLRAPSS
jgi:hypothetical protein